MKRELVVALFLFWLGLMVFFELALIRVLDRATGLPACEIGGLRTVLGPVAIAVGVWLVLWSVWIQFKLGGGTPHPRAPTQKLIVTGPYTFTRNPMTLGAALLYLGIAVWLGSIVVIGLVLLVFAVLLTYIYLHETKELAQRFGVDYLEYRRRTPFLIPCLRAEK